MKSSGKFNVRSGTMKNTTLTPEEYQRRGDAADALWRELVRRVTAKDQPASTRSGLTWRRWWPAVTATCR